MRVRFTVPDGTRIDLPTVGLYGIEPGAELDIDDDVAADLIAQGHAEPAGDDDTPAPVSETAASTSTRKKG
ncbi:MAG TPA: hypothetical protein PKC57_14575 [Microthrixaceae bacterium]|nr:hypothetical protein [Microthrixaceae bacterium]